MKISFMILNSHPSSSLTHTSRNTILCRRAEREFDYSSRPRFYRASLPYIKRLYRPGIVAVVWISNRPLKGHSRRHRTSDIIQFFHDVIPRQSMDMKNVVQERTSFSVRRGEYRRCRSYYVVYLNISHLDTNYFTHICKFRQKKRHEDSYMYDTG